MSHRLEHDVIALVYEVYGGELCPTPAWLQRPGPSECRRRWPWFQAVYRELTGLKLPDEVPPRESRRVDAVLQKRGQRPRIVEFDEDQHFNGFRAQTLAAYPRTVKLAFPKALWLARSSSRTREGGRPCPPLFPGRGGRDRQRAFRDTLADLLPLTHSWLPTLRIAKFEVLPWIGTAVEPREMQRLVRSRVGV